MLSNKLLKRVYWWINSQQYLVVIDYLIEAKIQENKSEKFRRATKKKLIRRRSTWIELRWQFCLLSQQLRDNERHPGTGKCE